MKPGKWLVSKRQQLDLQPEHSLCIFWTFSHRICALGKGKSGKEKIVRTTRWIHPASTVGEDLGRHKWRNRAHITNPRMLKTGMLLAIGITIHNIPEGIAVGAGYAHSPEFGLFIAIAILLHNIPEGIATALPLSTSGVYKWDAFRVATLSGLSEPVGALLAGYFLSTFEKFIPGALAFAGGVMVFITLDELVPAAREFGHHHTTALGIILGSIFVFVLSGLFGCKFYCLILCD